MALIKDKIKIQENKELLKNPRVQAMLKTIRYAEGTSGDKGYTTRVGGGQFNDLSKKPNVKVYIPSIKNYSSAEGAYQILNKTWAGVSKDLGLSDFSPESQDIAAVELIKRRGALDDILNDNFDSAIYKLAPEWASLPTTKGKSHYSNQKNRDINKLRDVYGKYNSDQGITQNLTILENSPISSNFIPETEEVERQKPPKEVEEAKNELDQKQAGDDFFTKYFNTQPQLENTPIQQVEEQVTIPFGQNILSKYNQIEQFIDTPSVMQQGGIIRDNIPNLQPNINLLHQLDPKNFTIDYIQSQKYRERLEKAGYKNIDEEIKKRLINVKETEVINQDGLPNIIEEHYYDFINKPYSKVGSAYLGENKVVIDPKTDLKNIGKKVNKDEILAHEFGHAELDTNKKKEPSEIGKMFWQKTNLNTSDEINLYNRRKPSKNPNAPMTGDMFHDMIPGENKSDLNALRFLLKKEGVYDAGKEDFTKEHLNKIKKKQSFVKDRLLKNYSEKDLIWLMNNIATNENSEDINYVQQGGEIPVSSKGMYEHPNEKVIVPTNGAITMKNINYPIWAQSLETGEQKLLYPEQEYFFKNTQHVLEIPINNI